MGLDRITSNFSHGKEQALRSALANLKLMLDNPKPFDSVKGGADKLKTLKGMQRQYDTQKFLSEKQISWINNGLIENYWDGIAKIKNDPALSGAKVKHDIGRKTLRFG